MTSIYEKKKVEKFTPMCQEAPPVPKKSRMPLKTIPFFALTLILILVIPVFFWQEPNSFFPVYPVYLDIQTNIPDRIDYGGSVQEVLELDDGSLAILCGIDGDLVLFKTDNQGEIIWKHSFPAFGGCNDFIETKDNGFALILGTYEQNNINQSSTSTQGVLIKLNESGMVEWQQTYDYAPPAEDDSITLAALEQCNDRYILVLSTARHGTTLHITNSTGVIQQSIEYKELDCFYAMGGEIITTIDGGYALIGVDLTEQEQTTPFPTGLILKIDQEGKRQWTYKHENFWPRQIVQMKDGTYIISGIGNSPINNPCLLNIDINGQLKWEKSISGMLTPKGYPDPRTVQSLIYTDDGGLALVTGNLINLDSGYGITLVKTDARGTFEWMSTYFGDRLGSRDISATSLLQTKEGDYLIAGRIRLDYRGYIPFVQQEKAYLVKTDSEGYRLWEQVYTGPLEDEWITDITQTTEGGYALVGYSNSHREGDMDVWMIKTDNEGNLVWEKGMGGKGDDYGITLLQTEDNGLIVGSTILENSTNQEIWLVKFDMNGKVNWERKYGGNGNESVQQLFGTIDDGIVIGGTTTSNPERKKEMFLLKIDQYGQEIWFQTYSLGEGNQMSDLAQTADNGFIISGMVDSNFGEYHDIPYYGSLIKTDETGQIEWYHTLKEFPDHYYNNTGTVIHAVTPTNNEIYVFGEILPHSIGWCRYGDCEKHPTFLMKVDLEGNLKYNNQTEVHCGPYSWGNQFQFLDLELKSEKGLIIAGKAAYYGIDSRIWELNELGSVKNEIIIPKTTHYSKPCINAIIYESTSDTLIVGADVYVRKTSGLSKDSWLAKINSLGEILWFRTYGKTGFSYNDSIKNKITAHPSSTVQTTNFPVVSFGLQILSIVLFLGKKGRRSKQRS
ncbi:MAG: hypothetical protein ACFE8U_10610 [Candidatus Hermodarchaeota archaeon]